MVEIDEGAAVGDGEAVTVAVGIGVGLTGVVRVTCAAEELTWAPAPSVTSAMNDQVPSFAASPNVY